MKNIDAMEIGSKFYKEASVEMRIDQHVETAVQGLKNGNVGAYIIGFESAVEEMLKSYTNKALGDDEKEVKYARKVVERIQGKLRGDK